MGSNDWGSSKDSLAPGVRQFYFCNYSRFYFLVYSLKIWLPLMPSHLNTHSVLPIKKQNLLTLPLDLGCPCNLTLLDYNRSDVMPLAGLNYKSLACSTLSREASHHAVKIIALWYWMRGEQIKREPKQRGSELPNMSGKLYYTFWYSHKV